MARLFAVRWIILISFVSLFCAITALPPTIDLTASNGYQHCGSLAKDTYLFFRVNVTSQNRTLHLYLTPIGDGDPDAYISWHDSNPHPYYNRTGPFDAALTGTSYDSVSISYGDYKQAHYVYLTFLGYLSSDFCIAGEFGGAPMLLESGFPKQVASKIGQTKPFLYGIAPLNPPYTHFDLMFSVQSPDNYPVSLWIADHEVLQPPLFGAMYAKYHIFFSAFWPASTQLAKLRCKHATQQVVGSPVAPGSFMCKDITYGDAWSNYIYVNNSHHVLWVMVQASPINVQIHNMSEWNATISNATFQYTVGLTANADHAHATPAPTGFNQTAAPTPPANYSGWAEFTLTTPFVPWSFRLSSENGTLQPQFMRYIVSNPNCRVGVTITVMQGMTELFVSPTTPNIGAYNFNNATDRQTTSFGSQHLTFANVPVGSLHIGVWGLRSSQIVTEFSIVITEFCNTTSGSGVQYVVLHDGEPQIGMQNARVWDFYKYDVVAPGMEVVVSVTDTFGDPDIYMSKVPATSTAGFNYSVPWLAISYADDLISISGNDSNACGQPGDTFPCTYYIGIVCVSDCVYTLYASSAVALTDLTNWEPRLDSLVAGASHLYKFDYPSLRWQALGDITFSVTPQNAPPSSVELYIATDVIDPSKPITRLNHSSPSFWNGTNSVTIPRADLAFKVYFVAVKATHSVTYTLLVSTNTTVLLPLNVEQSSQLPGKGAYQHYVVSVPQFESFSLFAAGLVPETVEVFVRTLDSLGPVNPYNATSIAQGWKFTASGGTMDYLYISATAPGACQSMVYNGDQSASTTQGEIDNSFDPNLIVCQYYVTVYAPPNAATPPGPVGYKIVGRVNYVQLKNGVSRHVSQNFGSKETYFMFRLNPAAASFSNVLVVTVTPVASSGVPDLYISQSDPAPGPNAYDQGAIGSGHKEIVSVNASAGNYFVGIPARLGDHFVVMFRVDYGSGAGGQVIANLESGVSLNGYVNTLFTGVDHQSFSFSFGGATSNMDLEFSVSPVVGNPVMYLLESASAFPSESLYNISSAPTLGVIDLVSNKSSSMYRLAVYPDTGSTYTEFSVLAYKVSDYIVLESGQQIRFGSPAVSNFPQRFFKIPLRYVDIMNTQTPGVLSIGFTRLGAGIPVAYISNETSPNSANNEWKINGRAGEMGLSITTHHLRHHFAHLLPGSNPNVTFIYMAVECVWADCLLEVSASFSNDNAMMQLADGVPQFGTIQTEGQMMYYTFTAESNMFTFLSVVATSGTVDMFASWTEFPIPNDPTSFTYSTTTSYTGKSLELSPRQNCSAIVGCTLFIGVRGNMPLSKFTIVGISVSLDGISTPATMSVGVPMQGFCDNARFTVYDFFVVANDNQTDYVIVVTPESGDPDLFVNAPDKYPAIPSVAQYSYRSIGFFSDAVYLKANQLQLGTYRSAVRCSNASTYTINAYEVSSNRPDVLLMSGVPQSSLLPQGESQLFVFFNRNHSGFGHATSDLTFTITADFGDPDVFINIGTPPDRAISTSYRWSSQMYGSDSIRIELAPDGIYEILVYAASDCGFVLSVNRANTMRVLQENVPVETQVPSGETDFYVFQPQVPQWRFGQRSMTILIQSLSGSDLTLFVSTTVIHPNETSLDTLNVHVSSAQRYASGAITIDRSKICNQTGAWGTGFLPCKTLYLTVLADYGQGSLNGNMSRYRLQVAWQDQQVLSDGIAYAGEQAIAGSTLLFRFVTERDVASVTITLRTSIIPLALLVSPFGTPQFESNNYTWSDLNLANISHNRGQLSVSGTVTILRNDPNWCGGSTAGLSGHLMCSWFIGVYRMPGDNNVSVPFEIMAHTPNTVVQLQENVPFAGILLQNTWRHFTFSANCLTGELLQIFVSSKSGDPDLYVSSMQDRPQGFRVNKTNANWSSLQPGADVVLIPGFKLASLSSNAFQIGVFGWMQTEYSLIVTCASVNSQSSYNNPVRLYLNSPQPGVVNKSDEEFFMYQVPDVLLNPTGLRVSIQVVQGSAGYRINQTNGGQPPQLRDVTWEMTGGPVFSGFPTQPIINVAAAGNEYYIGVRGEADNTFFIMNVQFVTAINPIEMGFPAVGIVGFNQTLYYTVNILSNQNDIAITLRSISTDNSAAPHLYISRDIPYPGPSSVMCAGVALADRIQEVKNGYCTLSVISEASDRSRQLYISSGTTKGTWYFGVTPDTGGGMLSVNFELMVQSSVTVLRQGIAIPGDVFQGDAENFVFSTDANLPVHFSLTVLSGSARLFVTTAAIDFGLGNETVTAQTAMWQSPVSGSSAVIVIPLTDVNYCSKCKYYMTVKGLSQQSNFDLLAHLEGRAVSLDADGSPLTNQQVDKGEIHYYYVVLPTPAAELQIVTTVISGDVTIVASPSAVNPKPTLTSNKWKQKGSILMKQQPAGTYSIGIVGMADGVSAFSVLAGTQQIVLIENYPQHVSVPANLKGVVEYFAFNVLEQSHDQNGIQFILNTALDNDNYDVLITNSEQANCHITKDCFPARTSCTGGTGPQSSKCKTFGCRSRGVPVMIRPSDSLFCKYKQASFCTYYVAIFPAEQIGHCYNSAVARMARGMTVVASSVQSSPQLQFDQHTLGQPTPDGNGVVPSTLYYELFSTSAKKLKISVSACRCPTKLYVSEKNNRPSEVSNDWLSINPRKVNQVSFVAKSSTYYYVGVKVVNGSLTPNVSDCQFKIQPTTVDPTVQAYEPVVSHPELLIGTDKSLTATVKFKLADLKSLNPNSVEYRVYFVRSALNPYVMYSACGLMELNKHVSCTNATSKKSATLCFKSYNASDLSKLVKKDGRVHIDIGDLYEIEYSFEVQVVGAQKISGNLVSFQNFYEVTAASVKRSSTGVTTHIPNVVYLVVGVVCACALVTCLFAAFFFVKYRRARSMPLENDDIQMTPQMRVKLQRLNYGRVPDDDDDDDIQWSSQPVH